VYLFWPLGLGMLQQTASCSCHLYAPASHQHPGRACPLMQARGHGCPLRESFPFLDLTSRVPRSGKHNRVQWKPFQDALTPIVGQKVKCWEAFWRAGKGTWDVPGPLDHARHPPTWEQLLEGVEAHQLIHNLRVLHDQGIAADMQVAANLHVGSCLADAAVQPEEFETWNKPWFQEKDGEWWCDLCKKRATAAHMRSNGHRDPTRRQPANPTASEFGVGLKKALRLQIESLAFAVNRCKRWTPAPSDGGFERAYAGNPYFQCFDSWMRGLRVLPSLVADARACQARAHVRAGSCLVGHFYCV